MSLDPNHREKILSRLIELAKQPAWKAFAWHQAKAYEDINPHDLKGLQQELKERMLKDKETPK